MPIVEKPICSICGEEVKPNLALGDRQGGLRRIVHGATTWQLVLCEEHVKPLFELYEQYVDLVLPEGTAQGIDKLDHLPVRS